MRSIPYAHATPGLVLSARVYNGQYAAPSPELYLPFRVSDFVTE